MIYYFLSLRCHWCNLNDQPGETNCKDKYEENLDDLVSSDNCQKNQHQILNSDERNVINDLDKTIKLADNSQQNEDNNVISNSLKA